MRRSELTPGECRGNCVMHPGNWGCFLRDPLTLDLADSSEDGRQRKGGISQERGDHRVVAGCPLHRVERVAVERENHHRLALWIDDPVLTDASSRIECPLGQQIMSPTRWTEDFNQEIGRAFDTPTRANGHRIREQHDDIWLHGIGACEEDVERGGEHPPA
jgi:hypothetical protein